jgi:DNA-binding beta-propeller fold protein YncE
MRCNTALILAGLALLASPLAGGQPARADGPYAVVQRAKVGGAGGFDYVTADADTRHLFVPRSAGRGGGGGIKPRVDVYDLDTLKPVGTIPDTVGVHGVAVDPVAGHGFASSNPIVMFDTKTLATIKTIPVDGNPDGILFEPATERVYVLSHRTPNVTVLDGKDGSVVGTIDLDGAPEQGQSDGAGHVYIDVEDKDNVAVVDARALKVTGHYDISAQGKGPAGLGLDVKDHVLFAFCRDPAVCVVLSADDGKVLATLPIGQGVDGGGFDPGSMQAFSSQGDGTLTLIKQTGPASYAVAQTVKTMRGAKTCTLDGKTGRILLITAEYALPTSQPAGGGGGGPGGGRRRGPRGQMLPDSFTILAVGK